MGYVRIYIYFDGNRGHLDRMIRSGVMNVYARWLAEGSSMGANISSDYLISVPSWFYSGLSSYFGETWNSDVDAHVMDGILTQRYADEGHTVHYNRRFNAHNQYTETALASGLPGVLALLAFLLAPLLLGLRRRQLPPLVVALTFIVMFSLLFESMLERQMGLLFVGPLYAIMPLIINSSQNKFGR